MKKLCFFLMILLLLGVNTAVWGQTFKIGVYGPMTGPAAEVGRYIKNGALLALDDMNEQGGVLGKKVELVFGDDEARPEVGVSLYERFMTRDKVEMVIGGLNSSVALAMQEVAAKYGRIYATSGPTSEMLVEKVKKEPQKYWMYFKNSPGYVFMKPHYKRFFKDLETKGQFKPREKTIFIIGEDTDWGRSLAKTFGEAMVEDGWKVVANEFVKYDQADYSAQMAKLRAMKPDILYAAQTSPAAAASLCKSFNESGARTFFLVMYVPSNPEYVKLAGKASDTLVWSTSIDWVPEYAKSFLERYRKRFNEEAGTNAGGQYDIMMSVFSAIKLAKSAEPRKIADAMSKIKNKSTLGVYQFDPVTHEGRSGDDFIPVWISQILAGKTYALYPERFKLKSYVTQEWLK